MEYADQYHLTDEEWSDTLVNKYMNMHNACILTFLINDLTSYEKELLENASEEKRRFNSVVLIMQLNDCSVEEAMDKVAHLYHDYEIKTDQLIKDLLERKTNSKSLKKIIDGIAFCIGGCFAAHFRINRYNKVSEWLKKRRKHHQLNNYWGYLFCLVNKN